MMIASSSRKHAGPTAATDQPRAPEPTFAERAHTLAYLARIGCLSTQSRKRPVLVEMAQQARSRAE